jgi:hypothetical protein
MVRAGRARLTALALVAVAVAAVVASACGVPYSSDFSPLTSDEVPFGLDETTSTTSSTSLPPASTAPASTSTTTAETTTTLASETVEVLFVSGSNLVPVPVSFVGEATVDRVLQALVNGIPPGATDLRAVIPPDTPIIGTKSSGVVTVELPGSIFEEMPRTDQRLVFGQIVLTLPGLRGVGLVRFLIDGEERGVALAAQGETTKPGELVSMEDYVELLADYTPPATTSTTSTTTTPPITATPVTSEPAVAPDSTVAT